MTIRRVSLIVLALLALSPAIDAVAAEAPPRDLRQVGDHWTAWNPPTSFPDGAEVYTITPGDTLWDLAARFFGDPYLWPQLWERNQYILDAHWIYPGDPLLVDFEVVDGELGPEEEVVAGIDGRSDDQPARPIPGEEGVADGRLRGVVPDAFGPPVPLGTEADIYCTGFIGSLDEELPHQIIGSEHEALMPNLQGNAARGGVSVFGTNSSVRYNLSTSDIVYLDGGREAGLSAGQVLMAVQPREEVRHPVTNERLGRFFQYLARVRVLSVQEETAIAEIAEACFPVTVGAMLRSFTPEPVPLGRRTPPWPVNFPAPAERLEDGPTIVHSSFGHISMGQGDLVFIDRGVTDDVIPGDLFTIYRLNRPGMPPVVLGELAILSVEGRAALGRIVESRYAVYVGDVLDRKQ